MKKRTAVSIRPRGKYSTTKTQFNSAGNLNKRKHKTKFILSDDDRNKSFHVLKQCVLAANNNIEQHVILIYLIYFPPDIYSCDCKCCCNQAKLLLIKS